MNMPIYNYFETVGGKLQIIANINLICYHFKLMTAVDGRREFNLCNS